MTETSRNVVSEPIHERDLVLIARIRDGDVQALGELMQCYALQLAAVAASVLGSNELVKDIVHDVFLALWEHRATLDVERNVAGYLYRAVRNRGISVLRRERSQHRIADDAAALDTDTPRIAVNEGERALERTDIDAQLHGALVQLSPKLREIFLLSWDAGLTYEEIAQLLGITTKSVTQQMYRATQRLAQLLPRRSI